MRFTNSAKDYQMGKQEHPTPAPAPEWEGRAASLSYVILFSKVFQVPVPQERDLE